MSERIHPIGTHAHIDLDRGALVLFEEHISTYLPGEIPGITFEAVFGGAPDTFFPVWPNRAHMGNLVTADTFPRSATVFKESTEIGVTIDSPFAIARWMPDTLNSEGFRVLELFIAQSDGQCIEYVMSWNSKHWEIHDSYPIDMGEIESSIPELHAALGGIRKID